MKMTKYVQKIMLFVIVAIMLFSFTSINTIDAKSNEIDEQTLFTETITIYNKTTKFDVGFVRVDFKKNFIPEEMYPITFEVELYAEDGEIYIEFSPDVEDFFKDVTIHVHAFEGYIFDVSANEYIYVDVPNFVFKVPHFSRWCFVW